MEIDPERPYARANLGSVLFEMGNFDQAIDSFQSSLKSDPDHTIAHLGLGGCYLAQGKHKEGLRAIFKGSGFIRFSKNSGYSILKDSVHEKT